MTSQPTAICAATRDDLDTLAALMREFYAEAGYALSAVQAARAFDGLLAAPDRGRAWLARADGEACGYVVLTMAYSMEFGGPRGFVDDFFVRPAFRGRGTGAALLRAVTEDCRGSGVRSLIVETGLEGHPARRLYARAGFVDSGRALMSRALTAPLHES